LMINILKYSKFLESKYDKKSDISTEEEFIEDVFIRMSDIGIKIDVDFVGEVDKLSGCYVAIRNSLNELDLENYETKYMFLVQFDCDSIQKYFNYILEISDNKEESMEKFRNMFERPLDSCLMQLKNDGYKIPIIDFNYHFNELSSANFEHDEDRGFDAEASLECDMDFYIIK
jgi:hypothetical protein